MKAGIITWHKEINHGAVLQAYATQSYLEQHGCEAILLNHNRSEISINLWSLAQKTPKIPEM